MPRRTDPMRAFDYTMRISEVADDPTESYSAVDPRVLSDDSAFALIAQSILAGVVSHLIHVDDSENLGTEIVHRGRW